MVRTIRLDKATFLTVPETSPTANEQNHSLPYIIVPKYDREVLPISIGWESRTQIDPILEELQLQQASLGEAQEIRSTPLSERQFEHAVPSRRRDSATAKFSHDHVGWDQWDNTQRNRPLRQQANANTQRE